MIPRPVIFILAIGFLVLVFGTLGEVETNQAATTARIAESKIERQVRVYDGVQSEIAYVRDEKSGLCFATLWNGYLRGPGGAVSYIPCELIDPKLLLTAENVATLREEIGK